MKKSTLILSSILLAGLPAIADEMSVGYCDGGNVETAVSGASAVAIRLPSKDFPMYEGSRIIGARIGLMTDALKGIDLFIRKDLAGEDILSLHTGTLYKGWSDIYFDSPLDWPAADICVGYELTANLAAGLSHVGTLDSVAESIWALDQGKWIDLSSEGGLPLCIQLLVDGDSYAKTDIALLSAEKVTAEMGKEFEISGLLRNNTSSTLNAVRLSCDWGEGVREADATVEEVLPGEIGWFRLPMEAISIPGLLEGKLDVVSVAGKADDYSFNNATTATITAVSNLVPRKVLIEEYTGQRCPNCPAGKERVEGGLRDLDNVILICHHIGFFEDTMTAPGSTQLIYFFGKNDGSSYAPAIMFDRTPSAGQPGPVTTIPESKEIAQRIKERQQLGAQVTVGIEPVYNGATRELSIDVELQQVKGMTVGENPVLTVALIENGIIAEQSPNFTDYEHNEAVRLFATSPLGDPVTLSVDSPSTYSYTVKIPSGSNEKKMEIVAFVSNHDSRNPNNCEVYNSEKTAVPESSAIGSIEAAEREVTAIYDITGRRLDAMKPGINIVRYSDGSTSKIMINE